MWRWAERLWKDTQRTARRSGLTVPALERVGDSRAGPLAPAEAAAGGGRLGSAVWKLR